MTTGNFKFNILTVWDLAHSHGHSAFRLLKIAHDIEREYRDNLTALGALPLGRSEYLQIAGENAFKTKDMFRISSASVMMFQAMMEAIIIDARNTEPLLSGVPGRSFKQKWSEALKAVSRDTTSFLTYNETIYKKFRIPMIHPDPKKLGDFDDLNTAVLLSGYREGWNAYEELYDGLGHPHDPDSWRTMCETHELPVDLSHDESTGTT